MTVIEVHFSHQTTVAPVTTVPATTINGKIVPTDSPNYAACPTRFKNQI